MSKVTSTTAKIPEQLKESFLKHAEALHFLKGDIVCHEGDYDRSLYLIAEGDVDVLKKQSDSPEDKVVATLHPDDIFGEINFVYGTRRIATVRAHNACLVYRLRLEQASSLLHDSHELHFFLQTLATKRWTFSTVLTLDLFSNLPEASVHQLLTHSLPRIVRAGTRLYSVGDKPELFYILLSGMLETQYRDEEPIEMFEGQCITPVEVLKDAPSQWRASTVSECILVTIPNTDILSLAEDNADFSKKLYQKLLSSTLSSNANSNTLTF